MLDRYYRFIIKYRYLVLLLFIPLIALVFPIGFNSFDKIPPELGLEDLGTDQDVFTFTSLTDDIIFVIDGDENLISEFMFNWTSSFSFELQNNRIVQRFAADATPIENIFTRSQQVLSPYYISIYAATGFVNVTSFIILRGTSVFLNQWLENFSEEGNSSVELVLDQISDTFKSDVERLAFGLFLEDVADNWLQLLATRLNGSTPEEISYESLIEQWQTEPQLWTPDMSSQLSDGFQTILTGISQQTTWSTDEITQITANYLFGDITDENQEFVTTVFDQGRDSRRAVNLAREALLPFIRNQYLPPGFPSSIRDFYHNAFTNSDGESLPTSMIIRFRLDPDLTEQQLSMVFEEMDLIVGQAVQDLPDQYNIAYLSLLNYQRERSEFISTEMHQIDLIAVIIGFIIMLLVLRNPIFAGGIIGIAWGITQITRGVIILGEGLIGQINGTSYAITISFLLGAAMNYVVFFTFRYIQEVKKEPEQPLKGVERSASTALHSVLISGIAVMLAMIPYNTSSFEVVSELSIAVVSGMIIQTILLVHFLPAFFGVLATFRDLEIPAIHAIPTYSPQISGEQIRKVLLTSAVLLILSLITITSLNSSFAVNDFIGKSGQTGVATSIIEENFPDSYLSKYLIRIETFDNIIEGSTFNLQLLEMINRITTSLHDIPRIDKVISPAWPLGKPFDFTQDDIGVVDFEAAEIVAGELITSGNTSFIIMQSTLAADSAEITDQANTVLQTLSSIRENESRISSITASGFPIDLAETTQIAREELGGQIILAVILLLVFLAIILKSMFMPVRLVLSIILANIYAIALSSLVYKAVRGDPLNIFIISSSFLILLGLGTDFDIYLIRRINEEHQHSKTYQEAITKGLKQSSPAIVTSGLVMACSFLALFSSEISFIEQFGLVTFIAILIDIFLIRTVLVPAILLFASDH